MERARQYKCSGLSKSEVKIKRLRSPLLNRKGEIPYEKVSSGCWIWKMGKTKAGYGIANRCHKLILAHRLFYVFLKGPIKPNRVIDHICNRRDCVNPSHMRVVENHQNVRRGVHIKMTPKKVRLMRKLRLEGAKHRELAGLFGISIGYVHAICSKRYWKDV